MNMGMSMPSWFDINSLEPELFNLNPPGLKEGPGGAPRVQWKLGVDWLQWFYDGWLGSQSITIL